MPNGSCLARRDDQQADLVMIPLRMALWQRDREGHPTIAGELIHHSDAGSQYTSLRLTEHLSLQEIRPSIGSVGDRLRQRPESRTP